MIREYGSQAVISKNLSNYLGRVLKDFSWQSQLTDRKARDIVGAVRLSGGILCEEIVYLVDKLAGDFLINSFSLMKRA